MYAQAKYKHRTIITFGRLQMNATQMMEILETIFIILHMLGTYSLTGNYDCTYVMFDAVIFFQIFFLVIQNVYKC
jgi:hypothetical protein